MAGTGLASPGPNDLCSGPAPTTSGPSALPGRARVSARSTFVKLDRNGIEVLDRDECRALLGTQLLGRIGVTVDALPVVLPVNFQVFDGEVVIQTERDTRLAEATHNTVVAFEVDNAEPGGTGSWSVTLTGIATQIDDPDVIAKLRLLPFSRWVRSADDRYVGISLDLMSGRRVIDQAESERTG